MIDLTCIGEIQHVALDDIVVANFNPTSRTVKRKLKSLLESIEDNGIVMPLTVASDDGILADGHRRYACAKLLGLPTVPVRVVKGTAAELFQLINGYTEKIHNKTWHQAVALGLPTEFVPRSEGDILKEMIRILGWEDYQVIALDGVTNSIYKTALRVGRYVGDTQDPFLQAAMLWMYNQHMHRPVIDAMKQDVDPDTIRRAITENKKLTTLHLWTVD